MEAPTGRGVLVIVVDGLRFDHTSLGEYDRDTTPKLREMAKSEGVLFNNAWSAAPNLIPAHVALLTGCDPAVALRPNVILSDGARLPPLTNWFVPQGAPRLAREFLAHGWHTAAFVDHAHISERRGFDDGFREFVDVGGDISDAQRDVGLSGVTRRFYRWVSSLSPAEDWMAYVHWHDLVAMWDDHPWETDLPEGAVAGSFELRPELDYVPPVGESEPTFFALPPSRVEHGQPSLAAYERYYDVAIRSRLDRNLARLFATLDMDGRWDQTSVLVVGSFGMGFGESGMLVDTGTYTQVDLHVPVILRPAPGLGVPTGSVQSALVSLVDLAPTLLDLVEIPVPAGMHGHSLMPLLRGEQTVIRERAFAAHGPYGGAALIENDLFFSRHGPGVRGPDHLAQSWFGDVRGHRGEYLELLQDRQPGVDLGLGGALPERQEAKRLRTIVVEYGSRMESVREVLHPSAWNLEKRTPQIVRELQAAGLVGEL